MPSAIIVALVESGKVGWDDHLPHDVSEAVDTLLCMSDAAPSVDLSCELPIFPSWFQLIRYLVLGGNPHRVAAIMATCHGGWMLRPRLALTQAYEWHGAYYQRVQSRLGETRQTPLGPVRPHAFGKPHQSCVG
jgi:hypothetical protein